MIINENLLLGYSNHSNANIINANTTSAVAPVKKGQKYTISYTVKYTNRLGIYFDTLSNGINGKYDLYDGLKPVNTTVIGQKINRTVIAKIDGYMVIYLANNGGDLKEPNLKIEEGDTSTPYIPSKNMLEPGEQAIFVAGGTFKEVYPI